MAKFLIQSNLEYSCGNVPSYDFCFTLLESIKYNNWYYNEQRHEYYLSDNIMEYDFTEYIPVGSVKFVQDFLANYYNIYNVKPINIPEELNKLKYTKRIIVTNEELKELPHLSSTECFVKSSDKIKEFTEIIKYKDIPLSGNYLVSDLIDIDSEWRAFVYNKELVGLQNYSGNFTMFPDMVLIMTMINDYNNCPPAYTLDVGINKNGTFIIEVHNFFSCGLYGFSDHRILPQMFIQSFNHVVKNGY